jgi:Flp pilus assembly protein TadB
MKENLKLIWGLLFIAALIVPYVMGVWDDYGYAGVVIAAVALVLILVASRQVRPTFWWRGLRKTNKKEAPAAKDNSTATKQQS